MPSHPLSAPWLSLAVTRRSGGRGRMAANSDGRLQTTANGFEDRGAGVRGRPSASAQIELESCRFRQRPRLSAVVRRLGCQYLGEKACNGTAYSFLQNAGVRAIDR